MACVLALVVGTMMSRYVVEAAPAQNCVTRPDGLGGTRMTCGDGSSATTRPDGLEGLRTTIQPPVQSPIQPYAQPYGQQP
jgi:hypothetical protein